MAIAVSENLGGDASATGDEFHRAAGLVVDYLKAHVPMGLWMVSRHIDGQQVYLNVRDDTYGVDPGDSHVWEDALCARMVAGDGPRLAPNAQDVPAYRAAPINESVTIGSYAGVPVLGPGDEGEVFGTICGFSPDPASRSLEQHGELLEMLAGVLGHVLQADARAVRLERLADSHLEASEQDELTGLANRRGWARRLAAQQERCRMTGETATVLVADLDGLKRVNDQEGHAAGDQLIRSAAASLSRVVRHETDTVARLGGDEFAVLVPNSDSHEMAAFHERVEEQLRADGVAMSLGAALLSLHHGVDDCVDRADALMYADKQDRKAGRS